jgi:single-strand DNA-binding protein
MALPTLTGTARLAADPRTALASSGVAVCSMQLAFNSCKQDPSGAWVDEDSLFIRATAFKDLAEHCAETLSKGAEVVVAGRVKTEQWTTQGEKRSAPTLLLDSIGSSLRYATATVTKAHRSSSNGEDAETPF